MRRNPTPAETILWQYLRRRQLAGQRFRRQHPIAGFIVDFYCPSLRLALEVDGAVHEERSEEDARRDEALGHLGVIVVRIGNDDVVGDADAVRARLMRVVSDRARRCPPPKPGEGQGGG
jgi:leucyl-tRNA synthetase